MTTKKILSLLLICMMLFSSVSVLAEEEATNEVVELSPVVLEDMERINNLKILGLVDSKNADNPQNLVTREEIVNVAANMIGIKINNEDINSDTQFIDISASQYISQIKELVALGAVNGVNAYQFRPERNVQYTEALKILLSVLGYGQEAEARNGYPAGYIYLASKLDIKSRVIDNPQAITWGELASMVEDCYDIPIQTIGGVGTHIKYEQDMNKTFLSQYHDVEKVSGQLTDNGYTTRTRATTVGDKYVRIGESVVLKGDTDIENALGEFVDCYVRKTSGTMEALFYKTDDRLEKVVIKATQIRSATVNEIIYTTSSGTKATLKISPYANFVYNNEAYPDFTGTDLKIFNGTLTLYDDKQSEGGYDLIIAEEYETMVVGGFNASKNTFAGTLGESCNLDSYKSSFIYNGDGEKILLEQVSVGDVASVYKSKGNTFIKVFFTRKNVTGEVTSIYTDDKTYYCVGDGVYIISKSLIEKINNKVIGAISPLLGSTYTFNLDIEGNIAGISGGNETEFYAYATAAGIKKSDMTDDYSYIRAAVPSVGFVTMRAAKKVTVNYQTTKTLGKDLKNLPALYDENGEFKPQLVQIKVNSVGDIIEFNTATTTLNQYGYNQEKFSLDFKSTAAEWKNGTRSFEGYAMHKEAPIFVVPDTLNEADFNVLNQTLMSSDNLDYNMELYDLDSSFGVNAAVMYVKVTEPHYSSNIFLVEKVSVVRRPDGEYVKQLRGYSGTNYLEYAEAEPGLIDHWVPDGIKKGDILQLSFKSGQSKFNPQDYVVNDTLIAAAKKVLSLSELPEKAAGKVELTGGSLYSMVYGPIYGRSEVSSTIITNPNGLEVTKVAIPSGTLGSYVYDINEDEITKGTTSEIRSTSTVYEDGSVDIDWNNICVIKMHSGGENFTVYVKR